MNVVVGITQMDLAAADLADDDIPGSRFRVPRAMNRSRSVTTPTSSKIDRAMLGAKARVTTLKGESDIAATLRGGATAVPENRLAKLITFTRLVRLSARIWETSPLSI